jgi:hypothetical protein
MRTVEHLQRVTNPEEWATHGDWATLHAQAERALQQPVRVLVNLEGGLVQAVLSDGTVPVDVAIVDYDSEGADDDEIVAIPQDGRYAGTTADAVARIESATVDPEFIANAFAAITAADSEPSRDAEHSRDQREPRPFVRAFVRGCER